MMTNLRYFGVLLRTLGWRMPRPGRRASFGVLVCAVLVGSAAVYGSEQRSRMQPEGVAALEERAAHLGKLFDEVEGMYGEHVAPIERVLLGYRSDDPRLVRRVAVSLVREARRTQVEPRLLLAVLLVENPWIDPSASSPVGAQGLMQVMPFWQGKWKACQPRLDDIESNICHGAQIFAMYLKNEKGNVDRALLRYNGCVKGTNTPNCHQYANHVYARAGRASVQAWRGSTGTMAAAR